MPPTVLPALALPARSVAASLVTLWFAPSVLSTLSLGQVATPDSASVQVKWTVTALLYQPAVFGVVVGAPFTPGAVRSMLTETLPVPVLPALSLAEALALRPVPSPVITLSAGAVAGSTPDRPS